MADISVDVPQGRNATEGNERYRGQADADETSQKLPSTITRPAFRNGSPASSVFGGLRKASDINLLGDLDSVINLDA